jgi:hypothetical protein
VLGHVLLEARVDVHVARPHEQQEPPQRKTLRRAMYP